MELQKNLQGKKLETNGVSVKDMLKLHQKEMFDKQGYEDKGTRNFKSKARQTTTTNVARYEIGQKVAFGGGSGKIDGIEKNDDPHRDVLIVNDGVTTHRVVAMQVTKTLPNFAKLAPVK